MRAGADELTKKRANTHPGWRLLLFWDGGSAVFALEPDVQLVIGRADECDLRVPHESMSRRHALLSGRGGWHLEDLGSSNGTFVDGVQLSPGTPRLIEPGKIVMLGDVRLVIDGAPPTAATRPIGESLESPMERVARLIDLVADSVLPVLLLGETGVGKGRLAEEIHRRSSRRSAPFVRLNCPAVPESLLESELFGHERGAFTGAVHTKSGLIESADGGTVFLDEIGEVLPPIQSKLLHVLEHNEVQRIGGLRPRAIDVRFVAATNSDIEALVARGQFRRDLYFRLAGVPLFIPPLRERTTEIPAIAHAFIEEACERSQRPAPEISPEAMARLMSYSWPGNIRELRNVLMRAALICKDGPVRVEHLLLEHDRALVARDPGAVPAPSHPTLPPPRPSRENTKNLATELRDFERQCLIETLERFGGHQGKTAEHLGISRRTLTNKLNELGLPRPRKGKKLGK
jgi:transcriptional regulator with GAF, ATPase, and Fis domain